MPKEISKGIFVAVLALQTWTAWGGICDRNLTQFRKLADTALAACMQEVPMEPDFTPCATLKESLALFDDDFTRLCIACPVQSTHEREVLKQMTRDPKAFIENLKNAAFNLDNWDAKDIHAIILCAEGDPNHQKQCRYSVRKKEVYTQSCSMPVSALILKLEWDSECKEIYISNLDLPLGEGAFKKFEKGLIYRDWSALARGELNPVILSLSDSVVQEELDSIREEVRLLQKFNRLSPEKRVGLPVTIYADEYRMIQPLFEGDLSKVNLRGERTRFNVVSQLNRGLENFHALGLVHSDHKTQNLLLRNTADPHQVEAVISDPGLAYDPKLYIRAGKARPAVGTPAFRAPEQFNHLWYGKSLKEKIANAQKGDVFAHGLVLLEVFPGSDPEKEAKTKYLSCANKIGSPWNCTQELAHLRNQLHSRQDALGRLIAQMLATDVTARPSATEVRTQFDSIMRANLLTYLSSLSLPVPVQSWDKDNLKSQMKNVPRRVLQKSAGYFFLEPSKTTGRFHLRLAYKNRIGMIRTVELKSDPFQPKQVQAEYLALKKQLGLK